MGRPEKPLAPCEGPVQRLASELRALRAAAGSPTYRSMACRAHYSATALAQAAAGDRLPSLAVVLAFARACGGDPDEWQRQWTRASEESTAVRDDDIALAPYRGLERFDSSHQHLFFGRDRVVDGLLALMRRTRFAALSGPSGSGKSSLLRAGVVPVLEEAALHAGRPVTVHLITPGPHPATTHERLLSPGIKDPERWIIVDESHELCTLMPDLDEKLRFIELLLTARRPESRLRVLLNIRSDFRWWCPQKTPWLDALRDSTMEMPVMTSAELREAIVRPAAAAGLAVERELTARLVDDVAGQPNMLPMLSHALLQTWRRRRRRVLTLADYEAIGGVRGAVAETAEAVFHRLTVRQRRTARRVLLRLISPSESHAGTRRPVRRAELCAFEDPETWSVLHALVDARLVTLGDDAVELAHNALITQWPRLRQWLDDDRERLVHHRHLTEAARAWQHLGRDDCDLYRGKRLAIAEELFLTGPEPAGLTVLEHEFLLASRQAGESADPVVSRCG